MYTHLSDFVIVYGFVSRKSNITAERESECVCVVIEYNGNNQLRKQMSAEKKKKEEVKEVKTNTELLRS